jgi:CDP-6-deoxy-D-xylo-4-hexulose-3-dehydrase
VLRNALADLEEVFILPKATPGADPSWFGFLLTVRPESGVSRKHLVTCLEQKGIQTRMLFAGNLLRHPCFDEMRRKNEGFRVVGSLENTDLITENTFWIGVYPGMTDAMLRRMVREIRRALRP